jgi:glycosyltransferase involved in cell wall biosynthesis
MIRKKPSCSLIISTYNWPTALELCLLSVKKQKVLPDEVIIADDGSGEETRELIEKFQQHFPVPLIHVWHPDDGFRKTIILNKTISIAKRDYIIQIDGDILVHPCFIKDHLRYSRKGYFIKGSRAMLSPERTLEIIQTKNSSLSIANSGVKHRFNALRLPALSFLITTDPVNSRDVKGCNMAFWKEDFFKINGYDNDLSGWGHEDIELAARFINSDILKYHLKLAAVCFHLYHQLNSRDQEDHNLKYYESVVDHKVSSCKNGVKQADNYQFMIHTNTVWQKRY